MKRNPEQVEARRRFVQTAIESPSQAAAILRNAARRLEKAENTSQAIQEVASILYVSESTIFKDITA